MKLNIAHMLCRMQQRGVKKEEVDECVRSGNCKKDGGRLVYEHQNIKVVVGRRSKRAITVLTKDVSILAARRLSQDHHARLADHLGVHAWYDDEAGHYELYGCPDRVANAKRYIESKNDRDKSEEMQVPRKSVGRLIGKGGKMIGKLRSESCCRIQVKDDAGTDCSLVKITGTPGARELARALIKQIV